jgi:CheY-like chemotaxis protein
MKSILVADNRAELLATLEPILKHWGYRVLSTRSAEQVVTFLQESNPCMLVIGEGILADPKLGLGKKVITSIKKGNLPCIALKQDGAQGFAFNPDETMDVPLELFGLFSFIQRKVEKHPRQNLRLRVRLPGMYSIEGNGFILADVLSLSMQGLFFKTATRLKTCDRLTVVFPLLGQGMEIEVKSTVLYSIEPGPDNNYFQGFGVGFDDISEKHREQLQKFIRECFLKEVSSSQNGVGDFVREHLRN